MKKDNLKNKIIRQKQIYLIRINNDKFNTFNNNINFNSNEQDENKAKINPKNKGEEKYKNINPNLKVNDLKQKKEDNIPFNNKTINEEKAKIFFLKYFKRKKRKEKK